MSKKIIISIMITILLIQTIIPIKIYAMEEETDAGILDTLSGMMLEPTVELVTVVIDAIMQIFTSFMTQSNYEFVMLRYEDLPAELKTLTEGEEPTITISSSDMIQYSGFLLFALKYPNFSYTPEEIFSGNIDLLDINFFDESNIDTNWGKIREIISSWYKVLRMIAIIGLLSVLIYTGIKIILSANTQEKAKYKEMLLNWFMAVVILFTMNYIMAFILNIIEQIMGLFAEISGSIIVKAGDKIFKTNLLGLARFRMQRNNFTAKVGHLIIYTALVVYTFKFTFVYLKRLLRMAFLTVIAPIVAITYPIDKMDGNAKGFEMWLKEYIYNALLQPMHYILYYILVSSSLTLSARNPLYGIAALMFISEAEKLLKKIFNFSKGGEANNHSVVKAFATGAIVSQLTNIVKDPLHPLSGLISGKGSGKSGGGSSGSSNGDVELGELTTGIIDDTVSDDDLIAIDSSSYGAPRIEQTDLEFENTEHQNSQNTPTLPNVDDFFMRYRQGLPTSIGELGGVHFDDGFNGNLDSIFNILQEDYRKLGMDGISDAEIKNLRDEIAGFEQLLQYRVEENEMDFKTNGIPLQYNDNDPRSTLDIINEIEELKNSMYDPNLSDEEKERNAKRANYLLRLVNRRMAQNQYIERHGGVQALRQQEQQRIDQIRNNMKQEQSSAEARAQRESQQRANEQTAENQRQEEQKKEKHQNSQLKGIKHVVKTIAKPVWDSEKDNEYNGKRLVGNIVKGITGASIGVAAAAVQAGISITDGKYNIGEGIVTAGAGFVGASKLGEVVKDVAQTYKEGVNEGAKSGLSTEEYGKQWFNRDDVIRQYNKEFPGQGKEMRRRAVDNYISRGITDTKEQLQALKYADKLIKERGISTEEADKLAIATLQYKQTLTSESNYKVLYDKEKRDTYIETKVKSYKGNASQKSVIKMHEDFIQNVRDFEKAQR